VCYAWNMRLWLREVVTLWGALHYTTLIPELQVDLAQDWSIHLLIIDEILWVAALCGSGLTVSAGGNVGLQSSYERRHLHRAGHFAHPNMHAGFQFFKMALHTKAGLLHKVGGEKTVHGRHDPGLFLDVAIAQPQFYHRGLRFGLHRRTLSSLAMRPPLPKQNILLLSSWTGRCGRL
jgi:hypothetical protein